MATVHVKKIAGTVYYRLGASSCESVTASDTQGSISDAINAVEALGENDNACYVCQEDYVNTDLGSSGRIILGGENLDLFGLGKPSLAAGGSANSAITITSTVRDLLIRGFGITTQDLITDNFGISTQAGVQGLIIEDCDIDCILNPANINTRFTGLLIRDPVRFEMRRCDVSVNRIGLNLSLTTDTPTSAIIEDNEIRDTRVGTDDGADCVLIGGSTYHDFSGTIIRRNKIHGYKDDGIDLFWAANVLVEKNDVYSGVNWSVDVPDGHGIKCGSNNTWSVGNKVINNRVHDIDYNYAVYSNDTRAPEIVGNLIHTISSGSGGGGIGISNNSANAKIYNNTVSMGSGGGTALWFGGSVGGVSMVKNNILSKGDVPGSADFIANNQVIDGGYNCLVNDNGVVGGDNYTNTNSSDLYDTDPLFADAPNNDFHLLSGSPCINAGTFITGVSDQGDIDGNYFQSTNPDIGAYYYQGTINLSISMEINEAVCGLVG